MLTSRRGPPWLLGPALGSQPASRVQGAFTVCRPPSRQGEGLSRDLQMIMQTGCSHETAIQAVKAGILNILISGSKIGNYR